jgi:putative membrane protein
VADPGEPRVTLANERTYLAWIRTALALIGGGVAAGAALTSSATWVRVIVGLTPILMGVAATVIGYRRWDANDHAIRAGLPLPIDRTLHRVAVGIAAIGVLAACAVILIVARS